MITCRRAAELMSAELDAALPFAARVGLGFHALPCGGCRRQLAAIEELAGEVVPRAGSARVTATLPAASRERL